MFKTQVRANPFRYDMKEPYMSVTCVFKLWFGTHYIVLKCKALHQALNNYSVQIDRDMRNGVKEGSILMKVIKHVHAHHINMMTCEVMFTSDDPLEILKEEYKLLKAGATDPKCLNHYHSVSFPASWIPEITVSDFQRWLTSLTQQKKAAPVLPAKGPKKAIPKKAGGTSSKKIAEVKISRGRRPGSKDSAPRIRRTKEEMLKLAAGTKIKSAGTKSGTLIRKAGTLKGKAAATVKILPVTKASFDGRKADRIKHDEAGQWASPKKRNTALAPAAGKISTKGQQPAQVLTKAKAKRK